METVVVFELRGSIAHYRRPDTLGTHASYPFIPPTTLRGLIAAVLGISPTEESDGLSTQCRTGLRLLSSPRSVAQELSLHGKTWTAGSGKPDSFHRPTSIELIVEPHYRAYYAGPHAGVLAHRIEQGLSEYHTYLGSAFCLTFPEWVGVKSAEPIPDGVTSIPCVTVVPASAVAVLAADESARYARVGGLSRQHIGGRRFRGTTAVIYEATGTKPVTFTPAVGVADEFWQFRTVSGEGVVCLW